MKFEKSLRALVSLIFVLSLAAALAGILPGEGRSFGLVNFRGEAITINARGLYHWDTLSSAAQMQANDLATLAVALLLLAIGFALALRGSLRGRLLLSGTLGYFLYTYGTMCFGAAYNAFFLVYVAIFGASLWAFIISIASFDIDELPARLSQRLPRKWIAVLLLRRRPWGYLLSSIALLKFLSLGLAVSLMGLNMLRVGAAVSPVELGIFPAMALANLATVVILLRSIDPVPAAI